MTGDTLTRVFAALADPTRRDMVARLAEGDATVSQLAEPYRMTLQAVYKHLRVLEDAGLVSRPRGPQPRPVRLEAGVFDLMDDWIERYRARAEQRYRRLDTVLAEMKLDAVPAEMKGDEHDHDRADIDRGRPQSAGDPAES
ncbi:ArsR/SmtB family transcription factor [Actinoplanes auranticolor]|uniref:HTH arsR-type domain-containing protein n=1 Tax=Actinoplanes auranticolor TaxID=47988 RepID=A0A919S445_9ACTN|nr:metalloregulator ArsR/SmtB family transcription factor [Actinoplanes auranticolor]GIM64052.1 hypothetical protein Aau02nite_08060 [Actinoplanes auranticolor]